MRRVRARSARKRRPSASPRTKGGAPWLSTPRNISPPARRSPSSTPQKGPIRVQLAGNDALSTSVTFVELAQKGFLRRPEVPPLRARLRHPGRLPQHPQATPDRWPPAALRHGPPAPATRATPSGEGSPPTRNNSHEDGALAMARPWIPTPPKPQFYLCRSPQHNLDSGFTPCSARPSRAKDVIDQLRAGDVIESVVIENAAGKYRPRRGVGARCPSRLAPLPRRLGGHPECRVKEVYEQRVIRSSK